MATTATNKQPLLVDRVFHNVVDPINLASGSADKLEIESNNSSSVIVDCTSNDGAVVEDIYTISRTSSSTEYTVLLFFSPQFDYLRLDKALYIGQLVSSDVSGTRVSATDLPKILAPVPHVGTGASDQQLRALYVPRGMALWTTLQLAGPVQTKDVPMIGAQGGFY